MMASRSASTRVTTCGGASIFCRKWRRRASLMGGVRPWLEAGPGGGCEPFGATTSICQQALTKVNLDDETCCRS